jgi:antitoxin YefM
MNLMNAVTVANAKENLERLIEQVLADAEPAILCTEKGDKVVLVSLDEFNSWKETIYLLSNPANAAHLRQSIAEARAGELDEKTLVDA